ncbi:MAG TPA: bacteriohemerythrin [Acidobacteriaceae bacterium]|jgi:hemerythrin-like metal-binding protein|nr:bacteriohemerythrin [Acidobacteriaceae bacterium]
MAGFTWNESYSVGVHQLDAQHQKLFEVINTLADSMRAGKGEDVIRDVVGHLAVYTRTHFLQEEVLMKQTGYPGLPGHQQQHACLMADVEKYKSALDAGKNPDTVAVLNFLRRWLVDHIQKSDKAYSAHMNGHGVH